MEFFDPKEDVLELKLTPWGRYKLSKGGFRPVWYAFFDEGVLYNSEWAGFTELQNDTQDRIMEETPSLKPLNVTEGIQTAITRRNVEIQNIFGTELILRDEQLLDDVNTIRAELALLQEELSTFDPGEDGLFEAGGEGTLLQEQIQEHQLRIEENIRVLEGGEMTTSTFFTPGQALSTVSASPLFMDVATIYNRDSLQYTTNKMMGLENPLGASKVSSDKNPAWAVAMHLGEISSSTPGFSGSADAQGEPELIPQLDITVKYNTYTARIPDYSPTMGTNTDFFQTTATDAHNLESVTTDILPDGTYLVVEKGALVLGIEEKNTDFYKKNFDIEVFISSSRPAEPTRQLKYSNGRTTLPASEQVGHYLSLHSDDQIDSVTLQKANIQDFTALGPNPGAGTVSTRQYFIKDLYSPEEDLCD